MLGISMFRYAGATGHVFTRSGGSFANRGIGWGGLIGPTTTVAVVPTTSQIVHFSLEVHTSDKQQVRVTGSVQVQLEPVSASKAFDFTVNPRNGQYEQAWQPDLQAIVTEQVLGPIRKTAANLDVASAVSSQFVFETDLQEHMNKGNSALASKGIAVSNCSVAVVTPVNTEVGKALGASEREKLLMTADMALHERRSQSATNERALKEYEAATKLALEEKRAELVTKQGENRVAEAKSEAEANEIRLKPLTDMNPSQAMAAALLTAAEKGSLNNVSLTTDLLAVLRGEAGKATEE
ncbi:MAG TPA: SPFH domain-containing protein [Verrucomicrobiae bacterium]|nr:SPFH domain-containing protein [Verrucomicrobiae bacterium]